jgi:hypothetical protein
MILLVSDARKSTRGHLQAAMREASEVAGKLIGCVLYNVGSRRWLGRPSAPETTFDPPDIGQWARPDGVDGHDGPSLQLTKHVDMTARPSL